MSIKSIGIRFGAKLTKALPTILVISGIGTGVAASIWAIKRSEKLHTVMIEDKAKLKEIEELKNDPSAKTLVEQPNTDDEPTYVPYDEKLYKEDRNKIIRNMTKNAIITYAPPIGLGVAAMTMILLGYHMKCKALIMMTTAYNTTLAAFKTYRGRVTERFGADVERDIFVGKTTEIVENVDADGNVSIEEKEVVKPVSENLFIRFAPETSCWHRNDVAHIRHFLESTTRAACNTYEGRSTPHLYLTELSDALGMYERDLSYSGLGWSAKIDDSRIWDRINLSDATIVNEDGTYVAYIPIMVDGMLS